MNLQALKSIFLCDDLTKKEAFDTTTAFKNYGDRNKTDREKQIENVYGAGIAGVLNGLIAGVTKGRVKKIIPENIDDKEAIEYAKKVNSNPEAFGLSADEANEINSALVKEPKEDTANWNTHNNTQTKYFEDGEHLNENGELVEVLNRLDENTDKELYRYLTGASDGKNLNDEIKSFADTIRYSIDSLGAKLVNEGVLCKICLNLTVVSLIKARCG